MFLDHNVVTRLTASLEFLCWALLTFYVLRVVVFIIKGPNETVPHRNRMREAMAMAYTAVAAYFIAAATRAIEPFMANIISSVSVLVPAVPWQLLVVLGLSSACVCTAFLCNFSRSLWQLKSLDHAIFAPVPEWDDLSDRSGPKKVAEFLTRSVAAVLFIVVEFRLERFAETPARLSLVASRTESTSLAVAGLWALGVYIALISWWLVGWLIAGKKMPLSQLFFYLAGVANSVFVAKYAGSITSPGDVYVLLCFIVLICVAAVYMLGYILWDPLRAVVSVGGACWGWLSKKRVPA
jgi:hypothetical protein